MSNTSIGPDDDKGGNENHDGRRHRTMGEASYPEAPPAGAPFDDSVDAAQARPESKDQPERNQQPGKDA